MMSFPVLRASSYSIHRERFSIHIGPVGYSGLHLYYITAWGGGGGGGYLDANTIGRTQAIAK